MLIFICDVTLKTEEIGTKAENVILKHDDCLICANVDFDLFKDIHTQDKLEIGNDLSDAVELIEFNSEELEDDILLHEGAKIITALDLFKLDDSDTHLVPLYSAFVTKEEDGYFFIDEVFFQIFLDKFYLRSNLGVIEHLPEEGTIIDRYLIDFILSKDVIDECFSGRYIDKKYFHENYLDSIRGLILSEIDDLMNCYRSIFQFADINATEIFYDLCQEGGGELLQDTFDEYLGNEILKINCQNFVTIMNDDLWNASDLKKEIMSFAPGSHNISTANNFSAEDTGHFLHYEL